MVQESTSVRAPWLERWRVTRAAFVDVLRKMGFVAADQYGVRREDAAASPHISILRDRELSVRDRLLTEPTAAWIGTAYFPCSEDGCVIIEVFGERNLSAARKIVWSFRQEEDVEMEARVADVERVECEPNLIRTSNFENWGQNL